MNNNYKWLKIDIIILLILSNYFSFMNGLFYTMIGYLYNKGIDYNSFLETAIIMNIVFVYVVISMILSIKKHLKVIKNE